MRSRLALIVLMFLTLAACDNKDENAGGAWGGAQEAPKVTVTTPTIENIDEFREFSGRFEASESVEIRPRVNGYLVKAEFTEGTIVKQNDPLYTIDPRPFEAALKKADADVKVAESKIAYSNSTYERAENLFKTGDLSAQIRDQRLQERDQTKAELERAKAAQKQAALDLYYTRITAPITGRIGAKNVDVGNLVNNDTLLTTIVAQDPIYFTFDMDEKTYISYARMVNSPEKHQKKYPVFIALADEKGYTHEGETDFLNNIIDTSTGTMRARAVLPNTDMFLTPGMFGRVRIMMGTSTKAVLVPDSAVLIDQSRKFVFIVDNKGLVTSQSVETGSLAHNNMRIITKGLKGDEKIITSGLQRVRDGITVTTQSPQAATPQGETK